MCALCDHGYCPRHMGAPGRWHDNQWVTDMQDETEALQARREQALSEVSFNSPFRDAA